MWVIGSIDIFFYEQADSAQSPYGAAVDPVARKGFLASGDRMFAIDLDSFAVRSQPAPRWPTSIIVDAASGSLFVTSHHWAVGGRIDVLDVHSGETSATIRFDTYPWKSVYDVNAPGHIGPPIAGPPTAWYGNLRTYRDISRAFNIPFGTYVQTFHAVEEYGAFNIYRDPSPSELRLNHFGPTGAASTSSPQTRTPQGTTYAAEHRNVAHVLHSSCCMRAAPLAPIGQ